MAEDNPWMPGSWVWVAWDHIGEAGLGATPVAPTREAAVPLTLALLALGAVPYPWFNNFSGDIDLIGQPKPQNYWRKVVYGLSPIEMLVERPTPPGTQQHAVAFSYYDELESWTWDVPPVQTMKVRVYTLGDSVTLKLNGVDQATNSVTEDDKRITTFSVPYAPGELVAIATLAGKEIGRKSLATVGKPAAIRLTSDVPSLTTSRDDVSHVLVEVVDDQGRRVPDAVTEVAFQVSGAGELVGVANGNPHNVDSFKQPRRHTWHGQALAVLRPHKSAGTVRLTASAPDLRSAQLEIPVTAAKTDVGSRGKARRQAAMVPVSGPGLLLASAGAWVLRRRMSPPAK